MFDLQSYNTFKMKVKAAKGLIIHDVSDLKLLVDDKYLILGSGSDVLFTADYSGTVLINEIKGLTIALKDEVFQVRVGGGMILDDLIATLIDKGICGLENLSLIPGTVGAAPVQNVGAYGVEIGNFIKSVEVFDLKDKRSFVLSGSECKFAYRSSIFKEDCARNWFITYINLEFSQRFVPNIAYKGLDLANPQDAQEIRRKVIELRKAKLPDPKFVGNAGSFFKNPIVDSTVVSDIKKEYPDAPVYPAPNGKFKLAAGWLIDKAGCRGITQGRAGTWEHQALVLVNRGDALPDEIVALGKFICAKVKAKFAIDLYPEVRMIGKEGEVRWQDL